MTTRRLILAIAIWILAATLVFVLWQCASAQRRRVEPSLYLDFPMLAVPPPMDIANHGNVWFDPNGDFLFRDHEGNINYLGDVSVLNSPNLIPPVGIDQNAPIDECYVQLSDKLVICREFTSAGVQACVDVLPSAGGGIIFPTADYDMSSMVTATNDSLTLIGMGEGTNFILSGNHKMFYFNDVDDLNVSGIMFDGNNVNISASYLVHCHGASNTYNFENCKFQKIGNYGLSTGDSSSSYITVDKCIFKDCTIAASRPLSITNCRGKVTNCIFESLKNALYIAYEQAIISHNSFVACGDSTHNSVYCYGASMTFTDNYAYNCSYSFYFSGCNYSRISNNDIFLGYIHIAGSSYVSFLSNSVFQQNGSCALYLQNCSNVKLVGNELLLDGTNCLHIYGGMYIQVLGNLIHGAGGTEDTNASIAFYLDATSNVTIAHNNTYWLSTYFIYAEDTCSDIKMFDNTRQTYNTKLFESSSDYGYLNFDTFYNLRAESGGLATLFSEATQAFSDEDPNGPTTVTIDVDIPTGARLLGCQLRVDVALATGELWDAAYSGGSTQSIATAQAVAKNTKAGALYDDDADSPITSGETDIVISKNGGGDFTAQGTIYAVVYYKNLLTLDDKL